MLNNMIILNNCVLALTKNIDNLNTFKFLIEFLNP